MIRVTKPLLFNNTVLLHLPSSHQDRFVRLGTYLSPYCEVTLFTTNDQTQVSHLVEGSHCIK